MVLARSMVSLTDHLPKSMFSSGITPNPIGEASSKPSNVSRFTEGLTLVVAFLASARFRAICCLILIGVLFLGDGRGGGTRFDEPLIVEMDRVLIAGAPLPTRRIDVGVEGVVARGVVVVDIFLRGV